MMLSKNGWITLRKKKKSDTMKYPTINFTGNKRKLVDWIHENMPIKNGTILDIFSGGCSVSYMFKSNGFKVISNDCLYANYVIAKAIIENNSVHIDKSVLNMDITQEELETELNNIKFLSNKLYFDYELPELAKLISISKKLTGYEKYLFLALLRKAMIRKLPYSRMNIKWDKIVQLRNEEYSYKLYGRRRAYHNESFTKHILDGIDEYNNAIFDNGLNCVATNMDVMEIANKIVHVDAVPHATNQRRRVSHAHEISRLILGHKRLNMIYNSIHLLFRLPNSQPTNRISITIQSGYLLHVFLPYIQKS